MRPDPSQNKWMNHGPSGTRISHQTPPTWSSVLVEELLESNVIDGKNMAMLKEQFGQGCVNDPSLLINLRHDKMVRASIRCSRSPRRNTEVMAEAKRILRLEGKDQKKAEAQNRIVDDEIKKFQNHIVNLRKINHRLERIPCPPSLPSKRLERSGLSKFHYYQAGGTLKKENVNEFNDSLHLETGVTNHPILDLHDANKSAGGTQQPLKLHSSPLKRPIHRTKANLVVCGNKLDEHNLQLHSDAHLRGPAGPHVSVFELLQRKYDESERLHFGEKSVRHPSPLTEELSHNDRGVVENNLEYNKNDFTAEAQVNTVVIENWDATAHTHSTKTFEKKSMEPKITKPHCSSSPHDNKIEKAKLGSMTFAYTKWMRQVCEGVHTREIICREKEGLKGEGSNKINDMKISSRNEKIAKVLQTLQKHKQDKGTKLCSLSNRESDGSHRFSKSVNDLCNTKSQPVFQKVRRVVSGSCEHRLNAQKDIIIQQKAKLEEQRKQIEEFKLSQLQSESERSRIQAQKTFQSVVQSCNDSGKIHAKPLHSFLSTTPENLFVERMEQRAFEQRQKRLLSQERRKQFEEQLKLKIKEEAEIKRQHEEELMRQKNAELQEMRRLERTAREEARRERERMIVLEKKADAHSYLRKLKNAFLGFKKLVVIRKQQAATAEKFYSDHLMLVTIRLWKKHVDQSIAAKMSVAYEFYKLNLIRHCFVGLMKELQLSTIRMQVAVDMYEFRLQDKVFHAWLEVVHDQHILNVEKIMKADELYNKILLRRFFSFWVKFPKVAQQDREKERRKTILRQKVQNYLPDYRPAIVSD